MKKNKYLLLITIVIIIVLSYSVFAESRSLSYEGFTSPNGVSEDCRCKEFCEVDFKCFFGVCDNATLDALNCTNPSASSRYERAERCPVCPACDLWPDCTYESEGQPNVFRSPEEDIICQEYYDYLINTDPYCMQTINYTVNDSDGYPVTQVNLLLGSLIDGIDYSNVFDSNNNNRDSSGEAEIPRCQGSEIITMIAAKQGYDADVKELNVSNDEDYGKVYVNFTLPLGTCHVDCTDSFNRCNPECEGFTVDNVDICNYHQHLVNGKNITQMCAYKPIGTDVVLDIQDDKYVVVECCEGLPRDIPRPTYDIRLVNDDNLVSIQKPVRLDNGEQAKLSIFYWN